MRPDMVFIGGCGSTGTTLLHNMLINHSKITGPMAESKVFCNLHHHLMGYDWTKKKWNTPEGILSFQMMCPYPIMQYGRPYCWTYLHDKNKLTNKHNVNRLFENNNSFKELYEYLINGWMADREEKVFLEKTPHNLYNFKNLKEMWGERALLICMVRDRKDTLLSLVNRRNYTEANALQRYTVSETFRRGVRNDIFTIEYNALVKQPEYIIDTVLNMIGLNQEEGCYTAKKSKDIEEYGGEVHRKSIDKQCDNKFINYVCGD